MELVLEFDRLDTGGAPPALPAPSSPAWAPALLSAPPSPDWCTPFQMSSAPLSPDWCTQFQMSSAPASPDWCTPFRMSSASPSQVLMSAPPSPAAAAPPPRQYKRAGLTLATMLRLKHLPLRLAAAELGVGTTTLKCAMADHGLNSWPYRAVRGTQRLLEAAAKHQDLRREAAALRRAAATSPNPARTVEYRRLTNLLRTREGRAVNARNGK